MTSDTTPTRRPIGAVRVSTVALLGVLAAIAVPACAAAIVMSGSVDGKQQAQDLNEARTVSRVVVVDSDSSVHITGNAALRGITGRASLTWHALQGGSKHTAVVPQVTQQYADGVLTLTKDCLGTDCGADIDIQVPPGVSVQVTTSNAGIDVSNVTGGVDLNTKNGSITASRLGNGDATMNTSNNTIDASFTGAPVNIWAHTSNDDITIVTDGRTHYYDKVSTTNGRLRIGNVDDRKADNVIDAMTTNGNITIK